MRNLPSAERRRAVIAVLLFVPIAFLGCAQEEPVVEEIAQVVEVPGTDLQVAALPAGYEVISTENRVAEFQAIPPELEDAAPATVRIEVGEVSDFGIDLVEITKAQKPLFEAQAGGQSLGANRLGTQFGDGWYARGRYDSEGGEQVEDVRIFVVHPMENRLITLSQTYPAGEDSAARLRHLFLLLGELDVPAMAAPETEEA